METFKLDKTQNRNLLGCKIFAIIIFALWGVRTLSNVVRSESDSKNKVNNVCEKANKKVKIGEDS